MLSYSVVICTLDRPDDLKRCFDSWLQQDPPAKEIIIIHGGRDDTLGERVKGWASGSGISVKYVRMAPSLVRQRNAGIDNAEGDVVFFVDDDAEYRYGYAKAILEVYEADPNGGVGGVQGTIEDLEGPIASRWGLSTLFMLPRLGGGRLQPSAWPAFYRPNSHNAEVEVFSGPAMSFRREVLREFRFDEALAKYWVGDDFEMAYRVSKKYRLIQAAAARLYHYVSPLGRDSARRHAKMAVVNHRYLSRKCFGDSLPSRVWWLWSELGMTLIGTLWLVTGRGAGRFLGILDGYRELFGARSKSETINS